MDAAAVSHKRACSKCGGGRAYGGERRYTCCQQLDGAAGCCLSLSRRQLTALINEDSELREILLGYFSREHVKRLFESLAEGRWVRVQTPKPGFRSGTG